MSLTGPSRTKFVTELTSFERVLLVSSTAWPRWISGQVLSCHSVVSSSRTVRPCNLLGGRWFGHWRTTWSTVVLFSCATLTGRRGGHTAFVQAGAETSDPGVEAVEPDPDSSWEGHSGGVDGGVRN